MRSPVSSGVQEARRLVEHRGGHRVVSLYLDLDPERWATAPARASQLRSLLDAGSREVDHDDRLDHEERIALREDLRRIKAFLSSPDAPFKGARSLAVFCSSRDDLFEAVQLTRPVEGRVVIQRAPYVEPMIAAVRQRRWLVVLVNRRSARLLAGTPDRLREQQRLVDGVHGQHDQGGWSQANYERSVEKDVDDHLRHIAEITSQRWRSERFDRLALGGPQEIVPRFERLLGEDVRSSEMPGRVDVDLSRASEAQVRQAVEKLVIEDEKLTEREALDRLAAGIGAGGRGAAGPSDTVAALNERRVQTLLLEPGFDGRAERCPSCWLLFVDSEHRCPADGSELEEVEHLREAAVESALVQSAGVMVVRCYPDLGAHGGIGALLRF
jgi:peptide subunit release factor 1 (eRF1)